MHFEQELQQDKQKKFDVPIPGFLSLRSDNVILCCWGHLCFAACPAAPRPFPTGHQWHLPSPEVWQPQRSQMLPNVSWVADWPPVENHCIVPR